MGQHEELQGEGRSAPPPGDAGGGRNAERDFHGERRRNDTHASTTDPDARLYRRGRGKEAKRCPLGHLLMENRNGLVVDAMLTPATGIAPPSAPTRPTMRRAWSPICAP